MRRKGNRGKMSTIEYDILSALIVEFGKYISLNYEDVPGAEKLEYEKAESEMSKAFRLWNPEEVAIAKDLIDKMSLGSREVLMVLISPTKEELAQLGSEKQGRINKKRLSKYIKRLYSEIAVQQILSDIEGFLRTVIEVKNNRFF